MMMLRGMNFLGAGTLLRRHGAYEFVTAHLTCQALEVFLKGVLLLKDYDRYRPLLKYNRRTRVGYGHNLEPLCRDALQAFFLHPLAGAVEHELARLAPLYATHALRYAGPADILFGPEYVISQRLVQRFGAGVRLALRECKRAGIAV
jgi:hypothetical protein